MRVDFQKDGLDIEDAAGAQKHMSSGKFLAECTKMLQNALNEQSSEWDRLDALSLAIDKDRREFGNKGRVQVLLQSGAALVELAKSHWDSFNVPDSKEAITAAIVAAKDISTITLTDEQKAEFLSMEDAFNEQIAVKMEKVDTSQEFTWQGELLVLEFRKSVCPIIKGTLVNLICQETLLALWDKLQVWHLLGEEDEARVAEDGGGQIQKEISDKLAAIHSILAGRSPAMPRGCSKAMTIEDFYKATCVPAAEEHAVLDRSTAVKIIYQESLQKNAAVEVSKAVEQLRQVAGGGNDGSSWKMSLNEQSVYEQVKQEANKDLVVNAMKIRQPYEATKKARGCSYNMCPGTSWRACLLIACVPLSASTHGPPGAGEVPDCLRRGEHRAGHRARTVCLGGARPCLRHHRRGAVDPQALWPSSRCGCRGAQAYRLHEHIGGQRRVVADRLVAQSEGSCSQVGLNSAGSHLAACVQAFSLGISGGQGRQLAAS